MHHNTDSYRTQTFAGFCRLQEILSKVDHVGRNAKEI